MTSINKEKMIYRKTADRLVREVQERINEVNRDPMYCYRIERAVIFGSYVNAPERDMIGDVDFALKIESKYEKDSEEFQAARERYKGTGTLAYFDNPYQEVLKYIRNRNPYISLHRLGRSAEQDELIFSDKTEEMILA